MEVVFAVCEARLITPSVVSERLKVNGSVARQAIRHLEEKGMIAHVGEKRLESHF